MPGFEIINNLEKKAVNSIFSEGAVFFAHGFKKLRKRYHVREFEKYAKKKWAQNTHLQYQVVLLLH